MKPNRRRRVHVQVRMVDAVKAREKRHFVGEHMPNVERIIEECDGRADLRPDRKLKELHKPPPSLVDHLTETAHYWFFNHADGRGAHCSHREVSRVSFQLTLSLLPKRMFNF